MGIPVFFEAQAVPGYDEPSYIANMQRLDGLLTRFPRMRWLLVMGPPVAFFAKRGHWHFPDEVARVYARGNLQMEIMFPITWGGVWDYPYPEAQALIKDLRDRYGAEKLLGAPTCRTSSASVRTASASTTSPLLRLPHGAREGSYPGGQRRGAAASEGDAA